MEVNEVCRAVIMRDAEQQKAKLDGVVNISLSYLGGKITKASVEVRGPLIPGAKPGANHDVPGKNFG